MKKILPEKSIHINVFIGLVALSLIASGVAIALQFIGNDKNKIVFVDSVKLLDGYMGMKEARKDYEAKVTLWKTNLDSLKGELESKIKNYQSSQTRLSSKEKALTEELLQSQQQQFLNYQQVISDKVQKADQELTSKV